MNVNILHYTYSLKVCLHAIYRKQLLVLIYLSTVKRYMFLVHIECNCAANESIVRTNQTDIRHYTNQLG